MIIVRLGPVSQKYRNFLGLFPMPQLPLHLRKAEALTIKLRSPLSFSYVKNLAKAQLFETSELQLDNWLFVPRKDLGTLEKQATDPSFSKHG